MTTGCTRRAEGDVSAVADPATGVAVYQTTGAAGWVVYGGTSASSPIIASVYALAGTPAAGTYPASYLYQHTSDLFDVTSGADGTCGPAYLCTAGYDGQGGAPGRYGRVHQRPGHRPDGPAEVHREGNPERFRHQLPRR